MYCTIPILGRRNKKYYSVRPLLFFFHEKTHKNADYAISELEESLEDYLNELLQSGSAGEVLHYLRSPNVTLFRQRVMLDQRNIFVASELLLVRWKEGQTEFLMAPYLPKFFFTLPKNETPESFVLEAVQTWIRQQKEEKSLEEIKILLTEQHDSCKLYLSTAILFLVDGLTSSKAANEEDCYAQLCREGRGQLRQVGKSHRFFAGSQEEMIQPATIRRFEEELHAILTGQERRSVILVGPVCSGRNRMVESMFQRLDKERNYEQYDEGAIRKDVSGAVPGWTLTPGGMVAGMSLAGQWEHRCRAIFAYASRCDIILRFKPFPGFLEAGKTAHGGMSIADVIRSELSRETFRAVVELTPEELRLLREKDRMLVRQFEILEMPVLTLEEEYEIIARVGQNVGMEHSCELFMLVLPTLLQLTAYFEPEKALAGRVSRWLSKLNFYRLDHSDIYNVFHQFFSPRESMSNTLLLDYESKTGHKASFFYSEQLSSAFQEKSESKVAPRQRIIEKLGEGLVGQREAVELLADTILKIRMHLNDLSRTAGAFLFVGPTGVGKTEAVKQLARVLYGNETSLIRFDANELNTSWSVAALLGNGQQEGSLTSAVRLHPDCVLLFDEIEKGHPDLADLLLQVLGEGRLTDSFGRIVSFTQCVVVFTSNLGVRQAQHTIGFDESEQNQSASYDQAIRDFFRPEWLNRLDAIIPFKRLTLSELRQIASRIIDKVQTREGFRKRKMFLHVSPGVTELLCHRMIDTRWGARGVIRMLEKEFITPAAEYLAETHFENVSVLEVVAQNGQTGFHAQELCRVKSHELLEWLDESFGNDALFVELPQAVSLFLQECVDRYPKVFPKKSDRETEEEKYRRLLFNEYCTQLSRFVTRNEAESGEPSYKKTVANLGNLIAQRAAMRVRKDPDEPVVEARKTLTLTEWDDLLSVSYACTTQEIGAKLEKIKYRSQRFDLSTFFDLFAVFAPNNQQSEGAVLIQLSIPDLGGKALKLDDFVPDWIDTREYKFESGTTPNAFQWYSLTGRNARYWMSHKVTTTLHYQQDSPKYVILTAVVSFDPCKESPKDAVDRWENDPNRVWAPVMDFQLNEECSSCGLIFPVEWIPKPVLDILNRYHDEELKNSSQEAASGDDKETNR
ncbi:MAG: AAA family ATPase [Thermoguttaceae bacterium]|nr:AAA family ATPase [Thermoguttaceae bacterium]